MVFPPTGASPLALIGATSRWAPTGAHFSNPGGRCDSGAAVRRRGSASFARHCRVGTGLLLDRRNHAASALPDRTMPKLFIEPNPRRGLANGAAGTVGVGEGRP